MYANFKASATACWSVASCAFSQRGTARERPGARAIFAKLLPREQHHVGAEAGIGV